MKLHRYLGKISY